MTAVTVTSATQETLARIRVTYRVPAYIGAPVQFEGQRGKVVGADPEFEWLLVLLDGERLPDLFHPRWRLIWLEENGPATAVPGFALKAPPALLSWTSGEGQWSGL